MKKAILLFMAVFISFAMAGCGGGDDGGGGSPANIAGTWKGKVTSSISGNSADISLTITQTGSDISGTLTCVPCIHPTGTISGTISGTTLTIGVVWPDNHSCGTFDGTVSGTTMSGKYSCSDPLGDDEGNWSVTRQ